MKALEPQLRSSSIKWNYILQTHCNSEAEAMKLFHGAVFKYRYKDQGNTSPSASAARKKVTGQDGKEIDLTAAQNEVEEIVLGVTPFQDSVVFKTFERNNWKNMLIVNDWTGSMYPYGAQAVLWHKLHYDQHAVKTFVFFNDGNDKLDKYKRAGFTGGVFACRPDSFDYILKVMSVVMKRGCGGDTPENNLEAILKGIRLAGKTDEVIMVADNNAGVRDMKLLDKIKVPVRIVLCGTEKCAPIHPHYLEIARRTGGSIHTIEDGIYQLSSMKEGQIIDILGVDYLIKKGRMVRLRNS